MCLNKLHFVPPSSVQYQPVSHPNFNIIMPKSLSSASAGFEADPLSHKKRTLHSFFSLPQFLLAGALLYLGYLVQESVSSDYANYFFTPKFSDAATTRMSRRLSGGVADLGSVIHLRTEKCDEGGAAKTKEACVQMAKDLLLADSVQIQQGLPSQADLDATSVAFTGNLTLYVVGEEAHMFEQQEGCYYNQESALLFFKTFTDEREHVINRTPYLHLCKHELGKAWESSAYLAVIFLLTTFAASIGCQVICDSVSGRIPHSALLFSAGFLAAKLAKDHAHTDVSRAIDMVMYIDPHFVFWFMLPALLYEDSASANWHVCQRVLGNSILLAVPGVILNLLISAAFMHLLFSPPPGYDSWPLSSSLLLCTILSATDPVAVVGALNSLKAPAKLTLLIAGESLLNDGSAFVFFLVFWVVLSYSLRA